MTASVHSLWGRVRELRDAELRLALAGDEVRVRLETPRPIGAPSQDPAARSVLDLSGHRDARGAFPLTYDDPGEADRTRRAPRLIPAGERGGRLVGLVPGRTLHYTLTPAEALGDPRHPAYRLRCEPGPRNGTDRAVVLLIQGEAPVVLHGITDNSFLAASGNLNPTSVSVRRLAGDPPLYLIRYDDGYGWNIAGDTQGRRHLVTRSGDTGHPLVDEWITSEFGVSNLAYSGSNEDLEISRPGRVLRWVKRGLAFSGFVGDGLEPGEPGAGTLWEDRSAEVRMRDLDPRTGAVLAERSLRPAGRRLLVADDGRAGWLRLTAVPLPRADLPGRFDPRREPERAVGSASVRTLPPARRYLEARYTDACWLYNRRDWEPADAGRAEGPLPAALFRPGWGNDSDSSHLYWSFPSSRDGRWTSLYRAGYQHPDPSRLRAVFDGATRRCYSAGLLEDGPYGRALLQSVRPHLRVTLASAIRRRTAPDPDADELVHYPWSCHTSWRSPPTSTHPGTDSTSAGPMGLVRPSPRSPGRGVRRLGRDPLSAASGDSHD